MIILNLSKLEYLKVQIHNKQNEKISYFHLNENNF